MLKEINRDEIYNHDQVILEKQSTKERIIVYVGQKQSGMKSLTFITKNGDVAYLVINKEVKPDNDIKYFVNA